MGGVPVNGDAGHTALRHATEEPVVVTGDRHADAVPSLVQMMGVSC